MSIAPESSRHGLGLIEETGTRSASGSHILVVDDDASLNRMVSLALANSGHRVESADDGESGWDAIQADKFDLLITDNSMPKLNGIDLLRRLRLNSFTVPAILMSADMPRNVGEIITLVSSGSALHKPFSIKSLLFKVGTILDGDMGDPSGSQGGKPPQALARSERALIQDAASANLTNLAAKLLAYEAVKGGAANHTPAIFAVCDKLRTPLLNLAGETGFRGILARALALSKPEVAWLGPVTISAAGLFEGLRQAEANRPLPEIFRGEGAVVAQMLGLLFTFLGEPLTQMLLQDTWIEISFVNNHVKAIR